MPAPDPRLGPALLHLARTAIARELGGTTDDGDAAASAAVLPALSEPGATFVTLTQHGALRGCIGTLEAWRPLAEDVRANARAAAFRDPRFAPLARSEWPAVQVEVSLLDAPEVLNVVNEAEALAALVPGVDGVIIEDGGRRATFLPQVWAQLPGSAEFLARLREKAGLPAGYWSPTLRLWRYHVHKWAES